ncbi:MAG: SEC-C metal-binding domain-containing protein [Thermoproteota archaeon]
MPCGGKGGKKPKPDDPCTCGSGKKYKDWTFPLTPGPSPAARERGAAPATCKLRIPAREMRRGWSWEETREWAFKSPWPHPLYFSSKF